MGLILSASIYLQADHHCPASRWDWCCLPIFTYKQIIIARQADGTDVVCKAYTRLSLDKSDVVLVGEEIVLGVNNLKKGKHGRST
jgi:hypothetical protein